MNTATATKTGFDLPVISTACPACSGVAGTCQICGDPAHPCHLEAGRLNVAPVVFLFEVRGTLFTSKRLGLTIEQIHRIAVGPLGTEGPAAKEVYRSALLLTQDMGIKTTSEKLAAAMGIN